MGQPYTALKPWSPWEKSVAHASDSGDLRRCSLLVAVTMAAAYALVRCRRGISAPDVHGTPSLAWADVERDKNWLNHMAVMAHEGNAPHHDVLASNQRSSCRPAEGKKCGRLGQEKRSAYGALPGGVEAMAFGRLRDRVQVRCMVTCFRAVQ